MKLRTLLLTSAVVLASALPGGLSAQPGSQPFVFYGEEPWGGSYLGVDTRDITPDRVSTLHLKEESGVEITMVDQDAPAGKAGLKEHDVILTVNDTKIESQEQLRRVIREIPAGRVISIGISRNGQPVTIKAQLAERKKMPDVDGSFKFNPPVVTVPTIHIPPINMPEMDVPNIEVIYSPRRSGLMVENLTTQLGQFFGVKDGKGVLIRSVEKGSRGEQAGFRAGDVIMKVDGSTVNDCSDFTRLLRQRKEDKATITVLRDHKEQNLTLALPERRSGSLKECVDRGSACPEIIQEQVAEMVPEAATAELKRIQPELEHAQKEWMQEFMGHQDEFKKEMEKLKPQLEREQQQWQHEMSGQSEKLKKEMEKMQEDLRHEQEQWKQEMEKWKKEADI